MGKWVCKLCGWVYDPEQPPEGVTAGTKFEDLPADFVCPLCGATKEDFELQEDA